MRCRTWCGLAWLAVVPPAAGAAPAPEALETAVEAVLPGLTGELGVLRGERSPAPVAWNVQSRDAILEDARAYMAVHYPTARLRDQAAAQAALGVLPPGTDLQAAHLALFADGVSAYYDPRRKTLVIPASTPPAAVAGLLAHEVVHALQDRRHDLEGLVDPERWDDDAIWAHAALVEGEAVCLAEVLGRPDAPPDADALQRHGARLRALLEARATPESTLGRTPLALRENLIFPYAEGTAFVAEAWRRGGAAAVVQCFADPPVSTEQILHPERYFDRRDAPTALPAPALEAALGPEWRLLDRDVCGEHLVRILFRPVLGVEAAARVAAGWDGWRYAVYEGPGNRRCLAFVTAWDTAEDAWEFADTYPRVRAARAVEALWPRDGWRLMRGGPAPPRLERRARRVWGLEGVPADRAEAAWRALRTPGERAR